MQVHNMKVSLFVVAMTFGSLARAHIAMLFPPPLKASYNQFSGTDVDYSLSSPLAESGANFPFKNDAVDGPGAASVASFQAGATSNITTGTGAAHGGGSCQISLSYDKGKSFKVIHSYIGSCPLQMPDRFAFTMPADAPLGPAILSWSWLNLIGNREFYLSPASVTITAAAPGVAKPAIPFSARPDLFVANLNNGCTTIENQETVFPDPGPDADVTIKRTTTNTGSGFTGTCAPVKGVGGGSGSSPATGSTPSSGANPVVAAPISPTASAAPVAPSAATSAAPTTSPPSSAPKSGFTVSGEGLCGANFICGSASPCCSSAGFCGSSDAYCGIGCQSAFGTCTGTSSALPSAGSPNQSSRAIPVSSISGSDATPVVTADSGASGSGTSSSIATPASTSGSGTAGGDAVQKLTVTVTETLFNPTAAITAAPSITKSSGFITVTRASTTTTSPPSAVEPSTANQGIVIVPITLVK